MEWLKLRVYEAVSCSGMIRGLHVIIENISKEDQAWSGITERLEGAMKFEEWLDNPSFLGLHEIPLTP